MDKTHTQGISPLDEKQEIGHAEHLDAHVSIPDSEKGPSEIPVPWPKDVINHGTEENKITFPFVMTLVGLSMAFAGSQLTALLFATLTSVVANDLGAGKELIWLFSANIIAIGAAAPFTGPFADMLGRKIVLMFGLGMSMVGTILCASTPNVNGYLAGQAMTGFGVAVQELLAISAVVELVPSSKRGFYVAFVISGFLPFTAGSLYGELIAQVNWRWNNCLVAIWNFLTLLVIGFFYRPPPRANTLGLSKMEILKHIDFLGGFLVVTGLVFLLVGLNWGGQSYPWASTRVISFLAVGVVLLLTFSLWQRVTKWPLFPHRLAQHPRPFFVIMIVIFCAGTSFIPVLLFWSMQVVSVYESNHLEAGIRTLPFGFCVLGGAIISAFVLSAFKKHVRVIMPCFCVIQATGIACMATVDPHDINTVWAPLIIGLTGIGGVLIPNQIIMTIISPDDLIATAASLTVCIRAVGQVVGLTIFYNQFLSTLRKNALHYIVPAALQVGISNATVIEDLVASMIAIPFPEYAAQHLPPSINGNPEKFSMLENAVVEAFGRTFPRIYYISIAFGGAACIASLFLGDVSQYIDEHVAVHFV